MMDDAFINQLPSNTTVVRGAKLGDYTTFRLGGACPALIDCPDAQALAESAKLDVLTGVRTPMNTLFSLRTLAPCPTPMQ